MSQPASNDVKHDKDCSLVRECQIGLLALSEEEDNKNVLTIPEFRAFKNKINVSAQMMADDFSAWILDTTIKPRKLEKPQDTKAHKDKIRREAWRTEAKLKEIQYVFRHYSDPQQYMEQYRMSYTFHNFSPQRSGTLDAPKFVSLSRLPWTEKIRRQQQLPPKLVNRIIHNDVNHNKVSEKDMRKDNNIVPKEPKVNRNRPTSSQPNSANTKCPRPRSNTNSKPSLLELQHKYKLDPNAIKLTVSKVSAPDQEMETNSGRIPAAGSRASSAKSFKETLHSRTRGHVNLVPSPKKMEDTEGKFGHSYSCKTAKVGSIDPQTV